MVLSFFKLLTVASSTVFLRSAIASTTGDEVYQGLLLTHRDGTSEGSPSPPLGDSSSVLQRMGGSAHHISTIPLEDDSAVQTQPTHWSGICSRRRGAAAGGLGLLFLLVCVVRFFPESSSSSRTIFPGDPPSDTSCAPTSGWGFCHTSQGGGGGRRWWISVRDTYLLKRYVKALREEKKCAEMCT